jgi:hypothetical protein
MPGHRKKSRSIQPVRKASQSASSVSGTSGGNPSSGSITLKEISSEWIDIVIKYEGRERVEKVRELKEKHPFLESRIRDDIALILDYIKDKLIELSKNREWETIYNNLKISSYFMSEYYLYLAKEIDLTDFATIILTETAVFMQMLINESNDIPQGTCTLNWQTYIPRLKFLSDSLIKATTVIKPALNDIINRKKRVTDSQESELLRKAFFLTRNAIGTLSLLSELFTIMGDKPQVEALYAHALEMQAWISRNSKIYAQKFPAFNMPKTLQEVNDSIFLMKTHVETADWEIWVSLARSVDRLIQLDKWFRNAESVLIEVSTATFKDNDLTGDLMRLLHTTLSVENMARYLNQFVDIAHRIALKSITPFDRQLFTEVVRKLREHFRTNGISANLLTLHVNTHLIKSLQYVIPAKTTGASATSSSSSIPMAPMTQTIGNISTESVEQLDWIGLCNRWHQAAETLDNEKRHHMLKEFYEAEGNRLALHQFDDCLITRTKEKMDRLLKENSIESIQKWLLLFNEIYSKHLESVPLENKLPWLRGILADLQDKGLSLFIDHFSITAVDELGEGFFNLRQYAEIFKKLATMQYEYMVWLWPDKNKDRTPVEKINLFTQFATDTLRALLTYATFHLDLGDTVTARDLFIFANKYQLNLADENAEWLKQIPNEEFTKAITGFLSSSWLLKILLNSSEELPQNMKFQQHAERNRQLMERQASSRSAMLPSSSSTLVEPECPHKVATPHQMGFMQRNMRKATAMEKKRRAEEHRAKAEKLRAETQEREQNEKEREQQRIYEFLNPPKVSKKRVPNARKGILKTKSGSEPGEITEDNQAIVQDLTNIPEVLNLGEAESTLSASSVSLTDFSSEPGSSATIIVTNDPFLEDRKYQIKTTQKLALPEDLKQFLQACHDKGLRAWAVGGVPRDILTGRGKISDYDIVIDATESELREILGYPIQRNPFPKEVALYKHGERFEIVLAPKGFCLRQDALTRDLTLNGLYVNAEGEVFDPLNIIGDFKQNLPIKAIAGYPVRKFTENPIRILRAIELKNKMCRNLDDRLEKAIGLTRHLLSTVPERALQKHLEKMLTAEHGPINLHDLQAYQIIDCLPQKVRTWMAKRWHLDLPEPQMPVSMPYDTALSTYGRNGLFTRVGQQNPYESPSMAYRG